MTTNEELDIITHTRAEAMRHKVQTGENTFLIWGYPTAIFLFMEFAALMVWHENWCEWLWMGIPLVGTPLMMRAIHKDYASTHHRTLEEKIILQMWIFVGFLSAIGGCTLGFAGFFEMFYSTFQGMLIGMGCFLTGVMMRYRPKVLCGIIGTVISFVSLFFQGDLWPWQLLIAAIVAVITLIIPGHLYNHYVKSHGI